MIESLDGSKVYPLPNLVECNAIPEDKNEIPTPQIALAHPHLQSIADKIPEIEDDVDILLLVGRDVPQLHKLHASRTGTGNVPWAQRLDLGWVIVGEACLYGSHKPEDVSVFQTKKTHKGRPTIPLNHARTNSISSRTTLLNKALVKRMHSLGANLEMA